MWFQKPHLSVCGVCVDVDVGCVYMWCVGVFAEAPGNSEYCFCCPEMYHLSIFRYFSLTYLVGPRDEIIYQIRNKWWSKILHFVFSGQQLSLEISVENASEKESWTSGPDIIHVTLRCTRNR